MADSITRTSNAKLLRTLTLFDLLLYGIVAVQPTAPMSVFGVLSVHGKGHVVTTILLALIAMLFTAVSYGKMAAVYPSAGSAFTYVGQEINPAAGYITGWSMLMDYVLNPIICVIWISHQAQAFVPEVPYWAWAIFTAVLLMYLNILGVRASAKINASLATAMGVVIFIFFVAAARYLFHHPHGGAGFWTQPFYDPATFHIRNVLGGTSIAVLTYIGFDGISTLSEETKNPRRNILLATVLTCLIIGLLSAVECYVAQLVWPASQPFPDVDTAFVSVAGRVWQPLFVVFGLTLLVANFGSGMAAQLGAARLLFGMGRSNALPNAFFGKLDPKTRIPRNNVIFLAVLILAGAFILDYDLGAEMLNFGALIAFMGVNIAALLRYYVREPDKRILNLISPACGFVICLLLWLSLSRTAQIAGVIWMLAGIAFGAWKTRGFRGDLVNFDFADSTP